MNDTPVIDVLILYTPEAAVRLGSDPVATIQQTIDLQNQIFQNSGVDAKVYLCGAELWSEFVEADELWPGAQTRDILDHILEPSLGNDTYNIKRRREHYCADIVSLWVELEGENTIGSAGQLLSQRLFERGPNIAAEEAFMHVVITAKTASPLFHFAHELGHNLGLQHDIDASEPPADLIFNFATGYVDSEYPFRTVMAYSNACQNAGFINCPRIPYYSTADPSIQFNGRPIGKPNIADNARALKSTIPFVAGYREKGEMSMSEWKLVYAHDHNSIPNTGAIEDLVRAIRAGSDVKILYSPSTGVTWSRVCSNVSVQQFDDTIVSAVIVNIPDTQFENFGRDFEELFALEYQILNTTGTRRVRKFDYENHTELENNLDNVSVQWFTRS